MKKNYSNLITVEKITASSIPTNKYSATFNEPVIAKSGDSYQADTFQADTDTFQTDTYQPDTYKKDEYSAKLNTEKSSKPYNASFENPTYPATFNEAVIVDSGDNYIKPDKLDGTGYSWSTEQQKEINKSENKLSDSTCRR